MSIHGVFFFFLNNSPNLLVVSKKNRIFAPEIKQNYNMAGFKKSFKGNGIIKRTELFTMFSKDVKKAKVLTNDENIALIKKLRETTDDNAKVAIRQELIMGNINMVIGISKMFNYDVYVETMDVISEGILGLNRAIDGYKVGEDSSNFASYASCHISTAMCEFIFERSHVCARTNDRKRVIAYNRAIESLEKRTEGMYGEDELVEEINKHLSSGHKSKRLDKLIPYKRIPIIRGGSNSSEHQDDGHEEYFADHNSSVEINILMNDMNTLVNLALNSIKREEDREFIKDVFGIDNRDELTAEELSYKYGITIRSAHQRKSRLLASMRDAMSKNNIHIGDVGYDDPANMLLCASIGSDDE